MNDESIAIAGWLLADLVLVLALLFLALTPGRDATATTIAAPVILDIGCVFGASAGETSVICTPEIGGGAASSFQWATERGAPVGPSDAAAFEASFEGVGAVVLTVSNDGGAHRAAFPVLPSPAATVIATPPIAAPVILDIGCVADTSDGQTNVTCTPQLGGDAPSSHEWAAERGQHAGSINEPSFDAWFESAGAVRLTVSNESGSHSASFPVLPPTPTAVVELASAEVLTDFRFDQIVLRDVQLGQADWTDIAGGRVRAGLIKSQELIKMTRSAGNGFQRPQHNPNRPTSSVRSWSRVCASRSSRPSRMSREALTAASRIRSTTRSTKASCRSCMPGSTASACTTSSSTATPERNGSLTTATPRSTRDEVRINIFFVRPSDTDKTCQ